MAFALLVTPASNRVYAGQTARMVAAELCVVGGRRLGGRLRQVRVQPIAGIDHVTFTLTDPRPGDLAVVASLSSAHALYERRHDMLRPVPLDPGDRFDDDLVTIPKYPGKTNEYLTRLLLNVTGAHVPRPPGRRPSLLDPLAGRGTSLGVGLIAGYDVTGVEVDAKDVEAYRAFLVTWLRTKRLKHTVDVGRLRRAGTTYGSRLTATVAPTKQAARAGDTQTLTMMRADTLDSGQFLAPRSFDVLVSDVPYGVKQGSVRAGVPASRHPLELLRRAVPVWVPLLREPAAVGLSFNTHVMARDDLCALLEQAGLVVTDVGASGEFEHRVDQSIHRDLVVATTPVAAGEQP